jgi:molybdate transport system regulatory protein
MSKSSKKQSPASSLGVAGRLHLERAGQRFLSGKRIDLLESIDRLGSITQAAKAVGLSYKGAWDAVDAMNNLAEQPLVLRATGGQHGGGSRLTDYGRQVAALYRQLQSGHERVLTRMQADIPDPQRLTDLLQVLTLRTSARNQLRGVVKTIRKGAVNADVVLDVGDGLEIFANITNESVRELGLRRGRPAVALIKSSFVLLSPDLHIRISARNRLPGIVSSITRGAVNSEVKLQLAGGRTLFAIVTADGLKELQLRKGSPCCALIKSSHVLIAVND